MRALLMVAGLTAFLLAGCNTGPKQVLIETSMGNIKVMLYPETPRHSENFYKLAKEGYYDGTLFHRVRPKFMIQGGDPNSKDATPGQPLGGGGPGYLIDHEIGAPHIRGTLAAARTNNPEKKSSGSQFFIVVGEPQTDASIDQFERQKGIKYNEVQRQLYKEKGGYPFLDMDYTVFGEVVEGMDVVNKIATVPRGAADRPNEDVRMISVRPAN